MIVLPSATHSKTWGFEEWLCNNEMYCGKILVVGKDRFCSFHYHKIKTEDFYILNGSVKFEHQEIDKDGNLQGQRETIILNTGDTIHLKPFTVHRFTGITNITQIIETSTQHFEEDSYRLEPSCEG